MPASILKRSLHYTSLLSSAPVLPAKSGQNQEFTLLQQEVSLSLALGVPASCMC